MWSVCIWQPCEYVLANVAVYKTIHTVARVEMCTDYAMGVLQVAIHRACLRFMNYNSTVTCRPTGHVHSLILVIDSSDSLLLMLRILRSFHV